MKASISDLKQKFIDSANCDQIALPVSTSNSVIGDDLHDANGVWLASFSDSVYAQQAEQAINHAGTLANALDECLEEMELEGKHNDRVYKLARAALAAYRGNKA